jgi:hypothetical protein
MPHTVDTERLQKDTPRGPKVEKLDMSKPQGMTGGLPVLQIPHYEFPRTVYKHPKEAFRKVEHRNTMHEVVDVEVVPTEHLVRIVACPEHLGRDGVAHCDKCKAELEKALTEGWSLKPYIPKPAPDPVAYLYEENEEKKSKARA